jgi:hypothetical protein
LKESLLQRVLSLLDTIESPVILHSEATAYPADELAALRTKDILLPAVKADRVPRPKRYGFGPDVNVHEGETGLLGIVEDDDFHYDPIPLTAEDTWEYPLSLHHVIDAIREDNCIEGTGFHNQSGLIYVGRRSVLEEPMVDVYLSVPNASKDSVLARCRRLQEVGVQRPLALLTPSPLDILVGDLGILASTNITPISLMAVAGQGRLVLDWVESFRRCAAVLCTAPDVRDADVERLIRGKKQVGLGTAARFLDRTPDHVRRLVASGDLSRVGRRRPLTISVESLQAYRNGTQPARKKNPSIIGHKQA